jgi:hypothetical protein
MNEPVHMNDPHILHARRLLNKWVQEINTVGMLSTNREYARELILRTLESRIVAECLVDFLAREFRRMADEQKDRK